MRLTGRFEELIVLRLSRTEDDEYLQDQLLRLNKSEARVVLLYATQYDVTVLLVLACVVSEAVSNVKIQF